MEALREILASIWPESGEPPARDLDYVEAFAGTASVSRHLAVLGYVGRSIDQRYHQELLLTRDGFANLASHVARLRPGGLLWVAPPCSDSVSSAWRYENALQVQCLLILSAFARARGVGFIWEQRFPLQTFAFPDVSEFKEACPEICTARTESNTVLWGTPSYLGPLARSRMTGGEPHTEERLWPDGSISTRTVTTYRWTGFPGGFGAAHAWAFHAWTQSVVPELLPPPPTALLSTLRPECFRDVVDRAGTPEAHVAL